MPSCRELANGIRALSMDAVQSANSGHPGMPMGMADIAEVLWNNFLQHNPTDPRWINRDRFILSNGHGSMLHYALLHLTGYDLSMEEMANFRQLHSKTPGHPELGDTPGIETTTGPLGQGLANAVGMALAEQILANHFNREGYPLIDNYTYVFAGDGCMMEGISHEACSLAGNWGLGKLICFWDDNGISIDGEVEGWFTDDTAKRFEAYHWHVICDVDGHDSEQIKEAITQARKITHKPTLICCRTTIAFGAPNAANTAKAHGAPLGEEEIKLAKEQLGWTYAPFEIPKDHYQVWDTKNKGIQWQNEWKNLFSDYQQQHPELAAEFTRRINGDLPDNWQQVCRDYIRTVQAEGKSIASRKASLNCLNAYGPILSELVGGSADLTGSNLTYWSDSKVINHDNKQGNYIHFGVREFAMTAIGNGLAVYGGFIPYVGTFLVFSDYARNAVRLAALMKQRNILVYTHDSLGLGEDGPTHQPVEHAAMLRLTPNMSVWRPCDGVESAVAWQHAIERRDGPTSLLFSRQTLPHQDRPEAMIADVHRGGYVLIDCDEEIDAILIATGSEVSLAVEAATSLNHNGCKIRVVSMPSTDVFDQQDKDYREKVLPPHIIKRLAIEAGAKDYWYKYVGLDGAIIGLDRYGESAPGHIVFETLGFSVENVINTVKEMIKR